MKRILSKGIVTAALGLIATAAFADRNPVGEMADYQLDRNPSRTSSLIQSGTLKAEVTQMKTTDDGSTVYEAKIDYSFRITFIGNRSGTEFVDAPTTFFTEEFLQELRRTKHYESPQFKIDHMGYADATTLDGHRYANCDKLKIYDIDQGSHSPLVQLARDLVLSSGLDGATTEDTIEDLVLNTHIYYGVPVLGAVKLDVSGKYSGIDIKAGADYKTP